MEREKLEAWKLELLRQERNIEGKEQSLKEEINFLKEKIYTLEKKVSKLENMIQEWGYEHEWWNETV